MENRLLALDPGRAFLQGRQIRDQREESKMRREAFKQQQEMGAQQREKERKKETLSAVGSLAGMIEGVDEAQRPMMYQVGLNLLGEQGIDISDFPTELNDETLTRLTTARKLGIEQGLIQPQRQQADLSGLMNQLPEEQRGSFQALVGADPRKAIDFAKGILTPRRDSNGITVSPDGTVQIGGSPRPLTKNNQSKVQEKVIGAGESLARLKSIKENYDPSFLTYQGKFKDIISKVKDKAGITLSDDEREALRQRRRFTQGVNQEFNAYRKLITGAAASIQELESLKKAMISEDLSPEEFEASFNEFVSEMQRGIEIRNTLTQQGLKPGTKQFGDRLDDMFLAGEGVEQITGPDVGSNATGSAPRQMIGSNGKAGNVMRDANGNVAIVFEDGTFEEIDASGF